jgi:DNA replication and repair protein RecF
MHLDGITLQHFRNAQQRTFFFPQQTTVVLGQNAMGKTSIIEAIHLLSTGESFRAEQVLEMVSLGAELGRVKAKLQTGEEPLELEVMVTRGVVNDQRVQSCIYTVNGVKRLKKNFAGKFFVVTFRPEDLRLIEGSPSRRRQFVDVVLSVTDREYAASLKTYEESLKKRNRLLHYIKEGSQPRSVLTFWTNAILKHGEIMQEKRRAFFGFFASVMFPTEFRIEYVPSVISAARLSQYADQEIAAGHTLIGPHKDDFVVQLTVSGETVPVAQYGSRGQQRLAVLWLKMVELQYLRTQSGVEPILLLDDILSELDDAHRQDVFSLLKNRQSVVTTTEEHVITELRLALNDDDKKIDVIRL